MLPDTQSLFILAFFFFGIVCGGVIVKGLHP